MTGTKTPHRCNNRTATRHLAQWHAVAEKHSHFVEAGCFYLTQQLRQSRHLNPRILTALAGRLNSKIHTFTK
eukprot:1806412-Amphidinium_carterae.1